MESVAAQRQQLVGGKPSFELVVGLELGEPVLRKKKKEKKKKQKNQGRSTRECGSSCKDVILKRCAS